MEPPFIFSCVCLKSSRKVEPSPFNIEMKDNFSFGEKLESVYPLLDIVFEYLNDKDLDNCMKVNGTWEGIAKRLLNKRSKTCWVSCYQDDKNVFLKDSGNLHFSNAESAIILFGKHYKLTEYLSLHEEPDTFNQMKFVEYFSKEIVSRDINYCILNCPKVVSFFSPKIVNNYGSIFDTFFLPEIPGIKTSMFYVKFSKLKKNPSSLEDYIKTTDEIKCLLLFDKYDVRASIDHFFKIILKETKPEEIAFGGGLIHGIKFFDKKRSEVKHSSHGTFCIAFSRERGTEPDFNAASIVIDGSVLTETVLNEKLNQFRKSIIMRSNSISFRICCQEKRGKEKEPQMFHKHFPNTPLLGLEAAGEIGWNSYNIPQYDESTSRPKRCKKPYPKFQHEWSTVFVVITWGTITEM